MNWSKVQVPVLRNQKDLGRGCQVGGDASLEGLFFSSGQIGSQRELKVSGR